MTCALKPRAGVRGEPRWREAAHARAAVLAGASLPSVGGHPPPRSRARPVPRLRAHHRQPLASLERLGLRAPTDFGFAGLDARCTLKCGQFCFVFDGGDSVPEPCAFSRVWGGGSGRGVPSSSAIAPPIPIPTPEEVRTYYWSMMIMNALNGFCFYVVLQKAKRPPAFRAAQSRELHDRAA